MRKLMITTALVAFTAGSAFAQTATPAPAEQTTQAPPAVTSITEGNGHLASNLIGEDVYNGTADDAASVGKVTDLVIAPDGKVTQIIVGVGGFLGIGAKDVALDLAEAQVAERDGNRWLVVSATKEALEAAPAFDRTMYDPAPAATGATGTEPAPATPVEPAPAAPVEPAPAQPAPAPAQ